MTEIHELIARLSTADEDTADECIRELERECRRGAGLRVLVPLLTHSDSRYVSVAARIASEVADGHRGREVFEELSALLEHADPAVRFGAIEGVALSVQPGEQSVIQRLLLLAADPDPGVRRHALTYVCWIPNEIVESVRDTALWPSARLLLSDATKEEIRSAIESERLLDQRMAVAGAVRNYGGDEDFIDELLPLLDDEVAAKLPALLRNRALNSRL